MLKCTPEIMLKTEKKRNERRKGIKKRKRKNISSSYQRSSYQPSRCSLLFIFSPWRFQNCRQFIQNYRAAKKQQQQQKKHQILIFLSAAVKTFFFTARCFAKLCRALRFVFSLQDKRKMLMYEVITKQLSVRGEEEWKLSSGTDEFKKDYRGFSIGWPCLKTWRWLRVNLGGST